MRKFLTTILCAVFAAAMMLPVEGRSVEVGASFSILDVFPELGLQAPTSQLSIEYVDTPDGTLKEARLDQLQLRDGALRASGMGYTIKFSVTSREGYLVLRIKEVEESVPGTLMKVAFRVARDSPLVLTRLDYMTMPSADDKEMSWPWIWARDSTNPMGAFAVHAPRDDAEFDENLLRMWVEEGLPHPAGKWTLEKARTWLADWQGRFSDQSCLVIGAKNRDELDHMTAWAAKIGMKRVYLHTDTWRGEYWPVKHSYLRVNPEVFPRGEKDLNDYTSALRKKGMSFAVHSTCMSIARSDPDYVRNGLHPGLSRWVRGTLARDAGAGDNTLHFRPAPGSRYPRSIRHEWAGPNTMRSWFDLKLFLLGDELVDVGDIDYSDADAWVLKRCRRGAWGKTAAAHKAGAALEGMTRAYGQAFVPDPDTALFEETIRRWAEFCTRNNVDHLECDALEDHQDRPWGAQKFSWLLSSFLTLPSTSNTSNGSPLPFQVEYWFRSSRQAADNHAKAGVAGGASTPLYLHDDVRMATGPYEILFKPAEMVGRGGNSFNVSYPWPMFGVTPEILANHGMVPELERLFRDWRTVLNDISPVCRDTIAKQYRSFKLPSGGRGNQAGTDVLFRPESIDGKVRIVPLRLVGRAGGELKWGFGQEFGPIVPRQYVQLGDTLALKNDSAAQTPEFVIRVMGHMTEAKKSSEREGLETGGDDAILKAYATGTTTDFSVHPLQTARHVWPEAAMINGDARPGSTVELRHIFQTRGNPTPTRARLFLQVDDDAVAYINSKKVFAGGRYDQAQFVDVDNLHGGNNVLSITARNSAGAGSLAAALHVIQDGSTQVLASDASWLGRIAGGPWGKVTELAAYGESVWPRAQPQLAVMGKDLMPGVATIEQAEGHTVRYAGDTLSLECRNDGNTKATHPDDRPSWATSLDMSDARGLGCTVTGDGSGAVLVITIEGRGTRDYIVPIDFTGTREIQIPSGEVAWGQPRWGWRFHSARFDYTRVRKVMVGLGTVPPRTHAKISVKNIRPLSEVSMDVQDFTITLSPDAELAVPGVIPSGHYLWYRGGNTVGLYDLNWNKISDRALWKKKFVFPAGPIAVQLRGANANQRPWLEAQFFTKGDLIDPGDSRP